MAKRSLSGAVLTFLLLCPWGLKVQGTEELLTNADVLSMVKAELPESTIVLAIQLASGRGATDFDTSPAALVELKSGGATEKVLNAVLNAQTAKPAPVESPVPGLPSKSGVYYQGPSGWVGLPSGLFWPGLSTSFKVTMGFWSRNNTMVLSGRQAQLQISEQKPTFYVRGQPERKWQVLRLVQKKNQREVWLASDDIFGTGIRFRQSDIREIEFATLGPGVFTIAPRTELDPGEYLLCTEVAAARRLLQCYEFGVRLEKPAEGPGAI